MYIVLSNNGPWDNDSIGFVDVTNLNTREWMDADKESHDRHNFDAYGCPVAGEALQCLVDEYELNLYADIRYNDIVGLYVEIVDDGSIPDIYVFWSK